MSIRTDVSDIPEGTSTIRSQLLPGRNHFQITVTRCQDVNQWLAKNRISHSPNAPSTQNLIATRQQCIGTHRHRSRQSVPMHVNNPVLGGGTSLLWGPTKCLDRGQIGQRHSSNHRPIHQSDANSRPICQPKANHGLILQSSTKFPIRCQSITNLLNPCQSSENLAFHRQSWTNSLTHDQFANP